MRPPLENLAQQAANASPTNVQIREGLLAAYADVYTPKALAAMSALARFNQDQKQLMAARIERRMRRFDEQECIRFLDGDSYIPRTQINVQDARDGKFVGSEIPVDLQRQWIQGTGPAAKPMIWL